MKIKKLSLEHYVKLLKDKEPFTFARYGDGEWLTILGYIGMRNSNGCTFTQALSDDLKAVLKNQYPYYHAMLGIARRKRGKEIDKFLTKTGIKLEWYGGDVFLNATLEGKLFPLIEQIRGRRVLYVGNEKLRHLNMRNRGFFPYYDYIQPPAQNAHTVKADIINQVCTSIVENRIDFIGWSSGLASKVFIDMVYRRFPEVTQIDFGSMFDGFFRPLPHIEAMGRTGSRSYIRKGHYDWERLLEVNTGLSKAEEGEMFRIWKNIEKEDNNE